MNAQAPLLSIITPVKNAGRFLSGTIDSIDSLEYENLEYIVVDGNSKDDTKDVVYSRDNVITQYIREPDTGIYDAMNKGWRAASIEGNILFLGAGDKILSLPENIEKLDSECVICGSAWIGDKRLFRSRVGRQLKFANTLHHQALIVPKRLNPDPPFDTIYRVYADFDFNQRLLKRGARFIYDDRFSSYALPDGLSRVYSKESYKISTKNFGWIWGAVSYLFYCYSKIRSVHEPV